MLQVPIERLKGLVVQIQKLEDKLMNASKLPMDEQKKIHEEIKRYRDEMAVLEKRTRK